MTNIANDLVSAIGEVSLLVRFIIFSALIVISYFLSVLTLRPLQRSMQERKRFIANISHELRTPLSIMKAELEAALLQGDMITKRELLEISRSNLEEVDRSAQIIQFLLNFSELETRLASLQLSQVNLSRVARKALRLVEEDAHRQRIALAFEDVDGAVVRGNATALEELVLNLLKNAIRFNSAGGKIRVKIVRGEDGGIKMSVADTGVGIRAVDLPHIFEPFYAGSNVLKKRKESAGLGLAIVRAIARLHRARVSVDSVVGQGTSVGVRFPRYHGR
ncbi:MAG: hypothetical protein COU11_03900 [Candidatus Harrisonbacteria bacterium CG10_big_fil_rev_8_21_14_0_10_49_15]|uniref:histidine kinase n=1 Tax=Candidatus Harrisonbacteria bacterium CG10_big_fil_rev_8_21_14_0_10_49_15 TaxID=1974587 RepID=A0A2H0UKA8_9BACT|nr:MAG: hypothetical protein COU11_03900 [Candidatus Harrisonbacteria bacterium CG10_big_fil_rev_8_21_14_0_10_49_15]